MVIQIFSEYSKELYHLLSRVEVTVDTGGKMSLEEGLERAITTIISRKSERGKIIVIGNGGSAAIASHMQNDLCKAVGVRSMVFNEAAAPQCIIK